MFFITPLHELLERLIRSGNSFDGRLATEELALPWIMKGIDPEQAKQFVDALIDVMPPWEVQDLLVHLERLGFNFAYGTIVLSFPTSDSGSDREIFLRRCGRFVYLVDAELTQRKLTAHRLFLEVLIDRLSAWTVAIVVLRDLSRNQLSGSLQGVLVERLLTASVYKQSLLERLIARQFNGSPRSTRQRAHNCVLQTIQAGMHNPYEPVLSDQDRQNGIDILLDSAIPSADPRRLFGLLKRVVGRELLLNSSAPPQFLGSLIRNQRFQRAANEMPPFLRGKN